MARLGFNFNPEDHQGRDFQPLPEGKYKVMVNDSDIKPNKAGTGEVLKVVFKVIEGPYENRLLFHYFNIKHTNSKAEDIGLAQLSSLCRASGLEKPINDSEELHGRRSIVNVKQEEYNGKTTNKIDSFYPLASDTERITTPRNSPRREKPVEPLDMSGGGGKSLPWDKKTAKDDEPPF